MITAKLLLTAALAATPLTITVHGPDGTHIVHGTFNALTFSAAAVTLDYASDRIFCNGFEFSDACAEVWP